MATLTMSLQVVRAYQELASTDAAPPDILAQVRRDLSLSVAAEDSILAWLLSLGLDVRSRDEGSIAIVSRVMAHAKPSQWRAPEVLDKLELSDIPFAARLTRLYLGLFLCAEGAFILMAIREYLQDLLGLTEGELIRGIRPMTP
jgi:hypothetical protein